MITTATTTGTLRGPWIQMQFSTPLVVREFGWTNPGVDAPFAWYIVASNDGANWTVLGGRTLPTPSGGGTVVSTKIGNNANFSHYRVVVTTTGSNDGYLQGTLNIAGGFYFSETLQSTAPLAPVIAPLATPAKTSRPARDVSPGIAPGFTYTSMSFGDYISNGGYRAVMQADGNLVVVNPSGGVTWSSGTNANKPYILRIAPSPNGITNDYLVIVTEDGNASVKTLAETQAQGGTTHLELTNGNLMWVHQNNAVLWSVPNWPAATTAAPVRTNPPAVTAAPAKRYILDVGAFPDTASTASTISTVVGGVT
jgi:hypothetical protein